MHKGGQFVGVQHAVVITVRTSKLHFEESKYLILRHCLGRCNRSHVMLPLMQTLDGLPAGPNPWFAAAGPHIRVRSFATVLLALHSPRIGKSGAQARPLRFTIHGFAAALPSHPCLGVRSVRRDFVSRRKGTRPHLHSAAAAFAIVIGAAVGNDAETP
jgi:hypothetical protein